MTNDEKAKEIVQEVFAYKHDLQHLAVFTAKDLLYHYLVRMAEWKDEQFWSKENIEKIIITYNSFPDRSCPGELVKKTIEKLKPENTKQ